MHHSVSNPAVSQVYTEWLRVAASRFHAVHLLCPVSNETREESAHNVRSPTEEHNAFAPYTHILHVDASFTHTTGSGTYGTRVSGTDGTDGTPRTPCDALGRAQGTSRARETGGELDECTRWGIQSVLCARFLFLQRALEHARHIWAHWMLVSLLSFFDTL